MNKLNKLLIVAIFACITMSNAEDIKFQNINVLPQGCFIKWDNANNDYFPPSQLAQIVTIPSGHPEKFSIDCRPGTFINRFTNIQPGKTYKISMRTGADGTRFITTT